MEEIQETIDRWKVFSTTHRNRFEASWYNWAPLAAAHGWLVLEPNYVGSTGYGDEFLSDIPRQPVSGPGRDTLAAADQLIKEGRVNPRKLAAGG